jgi:transposase
VSIASVALANRLNANLVRRWVDAVERSGLPARLAPAAKPKPVRPGGDEFVPIAIETASAVRESIAIELRHGATIVNVAWPVSAASECSDWLRTLLR